MAPGRRPRCSGWARRFAAREGGRLPLAVHGTGDPLPIRYRLPVASAQVKSAILLAGLNTPGETTVIEPEPTRDHTELMLRHFGAEVRVDERGGGPGGHSGRPARADGPARSRCRPTPPRPPFPLVAALIVPGSDILLTGVGLNPHRIGLIETLREMGADIAIPNRRERGRRAGRRSPGRAPAGSTASTCRPSARPR